MSWVPVFDKREIRTFHVVVEQPRLRNVLKNVTHVQSWFFANLNQLLISRSRCRHRRRSLSFLRELLAKTTTTVVKTSPKNGQFAQFVKSRRFCPRLELLRTYPASKRERKIRTRMSTSSRKRCIRWFHAVVVKRASRKWTEKRNVRRCRTVVLLMKPNVFWRYRCRCRRGCLSSLNLIYELAITRGYGVRMTTIAGQNTFAPSLCFA